MKGFSDLFSEAMGVTVREVFGESASELIYTFMEKHARLKREEIGEKIGTFSAYLEKLLGSERAQILQAAGLKYLCLRLKREYEDVEKYFSVLDELYEVKFKLLVPLLKEEHSVCN